MWKNKKLWIPIGSTLLVPITTVISCGPTKKNAPSKVSLKTITNANIKVMINEIVSNKLKLPSEVTMPNLTSKVIKNKDGITFAQKGDFVSDDTKGSLSYIITATLDDQKSDFTVTFPKGSFQTTIERKIANTIASNKETLKSITKDNIKEMISEIKSNKNELPSEVVMPSLRGNLYRKYRGKGIAFTQKGSFVSDDTKGSLSYVITSTLGDQTIDIIVSFPEGSFQTTVERKETTLVNNKRKLKEKIIIDEVALISGAVKPVSLTYDYAPLKSALSTEVAKNSNNDIAIINEALKKADEIIAKANHYNDEIRTANVKVKLEDILKNIEDDGLYVLKETYDGQLYSKDNRWIAKTKKEPTNKEYVKISKFAGWTKNVVQLKKGDSIWMLYDNDDNDGFNDDNFDSTASFYDSSLSYDKDLRSSLISKGYAKKIQTSYLPDRVRHSLDIPFIKESESNGYLSQYFGSQSSRLGQHGQKFSIAMKNLKSKVTQSDYALIEKYYKSASRHFQPLFIKKGYFTYKKIANRAIKITFNGISPMTVASFRLTNSNLKKSIKYGIFSLTQLDWPAYENPKKSYEIIARGNRKS